ncbi:PilN domain-containing protein [Methylosinus sp. H3A]|uniref:PilN domain-containing protein n=1 Tax=Methylosinus sp. H3A TaxID=2785786 RepID=UPI0018C29B02|nr:PilN domain-containing protein [Methylosinus sp. H3A]MBG0808321.1 PilN domain-containing protein [Methylosinus sp. H3A]
MSSPSSIWRKEFFEGSLASSASRAWNWYRAEFFALFSPPTLAWLLDRGERRLLLRVGRQREPLQLLSADGHALADPVSAEELSASSIDEALERRGATRAATKIVVEIPREAFFVRRFDAPLAAQPDLPRLLASEVERKTPFLLADILHGHVAEPHPQSPSKLVVEQWILRRDLLPGLLDGSGLSVDDLDLAQPAPAGEAATSVPALTVGRAVEAPHWERKAALALAVVAIAFFVLGVAVTVWRQERDAAALDVEIAEMSRRAADARKLAEQAASESRLLATLREERAKYPAFVDLWEEVSRILPDGAFVSDLRLAEAREGERSIEIVGLADSAASLPALFDRSSLFVDAKLTAPITPDPIEKRESFSLQVTVRRRQ